MRFTIILPLLAGAALGALTPLPDIFACDAGVTLTHSSGETCCACGYKENTVEQIKAGSSGNTFCILVVGQTNINLPPPDSDADYAPTQCQNHTANQTLDYTVQLKRSTNCYQGTTFTMDANQGGGGSGCGVSHTDSRPTLCNCP
jgi:hypothetical protein